MLMCSYVIQLTVPTLLRRWKSLEDGLEVSAETFEALCDRFKSRIQKWLQEDRQAQIKRLDNPAAMDIYDTAMEKGMRS
jgi:hypothetical protein